MYICTRSIFAPVDFGFMGMAKFAWNTYVILYHAAMQLGFETDGTLRGLCMLQYVCHVHSLPIKSFDWDEREKVGTIGFFVFVLFLAVQVYILLLFIVYKYLTVLNAEHTCQMWREINATSMLNCFSCTPPTPSHAHAHIHTHATPHALMLYLWHMS